MLGNAEETVTEQVQHGQEEEQQERKEDAEIQEGVEEVEEGTKVCYGWIFYSAYAVQ